MKAKHPAQLIPLSTVTALFGYIDTPNFRQSVAPRLGLPILKVGRRWFSSSAEVYRVLDAVFGPVDKNPEKQD